MSTNKRNTEQTDESFDKFSTARDSKGRFYSYYYQNEKFSYAIIKIYTIRLTPDHILSLLNDWAYMFLDIFWFYSHIWIQEDLQTFFVYLFFTTPEKICAQKFISIQLILTIMTLWYVLMTNCWNSNFYKANFTENAYVWIWKLYWQML